jgi:hypothetical protein
LPDNVYDGELNPILVELMIKLWRDGGVQASYARSNEYRYRGQLSTSPLGANFNPKGEVVPQG